MVQQPLTLSEKSRNSKGHLLGMSILKIRLRYYSRSELSLTPFIYIWPLYACWARSESHSFRVITEGRHTAHG